MHIFLSFLTMSSRECYDALGEKSELPLASAKIKPFVLRVFDVHCNGAFD